MKSGVFIAGGKMEYVHGAGKLPETRRGVAAVPDCIHGDGLDGYNYRTAAAQLHLFAGPDDLVLPLVVIFFKHTHVTVPGIQGGGPGHVEKVFDGSVGDQVIRELAVVYFGCPGYLLALKKARQRLFKALQRAGNTPIQAVCTRVREAGHFNHSLNPDNKSRFGSPGPPARLINTIAVVYKIKYQI